jgi:hypothetical protein
MSAAETLDRLTLSGNTHPDAELIELCNNYVAESERKQHQWEAADEIERRALALHFPPWVPRQESDPLYHLAQRISFIGARTVDGVRAKARVMRRWLVYTYGVSEIDQRPHFATDAEMATAWSLIDDLLGKSKA